MKLTPHCKILKGLSSAQKEVVLLLIQNGTLRSEDCPRVATLYRLRDRGTIELDPSSGLWRLSGIWRTILEADGRKETPAAIRRGNGRHIAMEGNRTWKRPKAEYSNILTGTRLVDEIIFNS